jgi:hypothetical protein
VSTLDKVVGWFVVREDDAAVPSSAETAPEPTRPATRGTASPSHDTTTFAEMYGRAGIDAADQERVTRALVLLRELPSEASIEVRRAIVAASMKAFDVPLDVLRATATAQLRALDAYAKTGAERSAEIVSDAHQRIARLEAQIAEIRGLIELQKRTHDELLRSTEAEQARIRALEDFFIR